MLAKSLEKTRPTCCFVFQNLRLGSIQLFQLYAPQTKIFENKTADWACLFDVLCEGCEYSIWATNHRKVTRKDTANRLFRFPKYSFGSSRRQLVPFFGQSPFWTNSQKCQPSIQVDTFGYLSKMEIVQKKGTSCRRLFGRHKVGFEITLPVSARPAVYQTV